MGRKTGSLNKVQKPKKEPKTKGRPKGSKNLKQKQKQQQHQIVNINIGSRTAQQNEKRKKKKENLLQKIPSLIYNPSLIVPTYNVSNRDAVNPSFIQDMVEQLTQPSPQQPIPGVIKESIKQPVQPIPQPNKPIPQPTKPIEPVTVQPIDIKPIPKDEPKPVVPEIVGEIIGSTSIHDKHTKHKENKIKFVDSEGLGKKIPISRIGQMVGGIASGALSGGAITAGEAVLTGGLSALSLEGVGAGLIGGGVSSGVYNALGDNAGAAGHIISGIAGGVAGRQVIKIKNKIKQNKQVQEEIFKGKGEKLGGSELKSKLIEDVKPNQPLYSDKPHEIKGPSKSTIDSIKESFNNAKTSLTDTIQQLKDKITKPKKGTYSKLSQHEEEMNPVTQEDFESFLKKDQERGKDLKRQKKLDPNKPKDPVETLAAAIKRTVQNKNIHGKEYERIKQDEVWRKEQEKILRDSMDKREKNFSVAKIQGALRGKTESLEYQKKLQAAEKIKAAALRNTYQIEYNDYDTSLRHELDTTASNLVDNAIRGATNQIKLKNVVDKNLAYVRQLKRPEIKAKHELSKERQRGKMQMLEDQMKGQYQQFLGSKQGIEISSLPLTAKQQAKQARQQNVAVSKQVAEEERAATGRVELFGGLRSGAVRVQDFKERNPELTQLRQQLSDNKRGKNTLTEIEKAYIQKQINDLEQQNAKLGPKRGRPKKDK